MRVFASAVASLALTLSAFLAPALLVSYECGTVSARGGSCNGSLDDGGATVVGGIPSGGSPSPSAPGSDHAGGPGPRATPGPATPGPIERPVDANGCQSFETAQGDTFRVCPPPAPEVDEGDAPPAPTVTITDVAHFAPTPGSLASEPGGWGVVGLPVNLYSEASGHVVDATLLGRPASVRFTPVSMHWDHGDGTSATHSHGGASWAELGLAEFSVTDTGHTYDARGTYTLSATVEYGAEYAIDGSGWIPLAGTVPVTLPATDILIAAADTVLVDGDCAARPGAPGC